MDFYETLSNVCNDMTNGTGVEFRLMTDWNVGDGRLFVSSQEMELRDVFIGARRPEGMSDDAALVSSVIAVFHEFRHIAQVEAIHNPDVCLSGLSERESMIVCASYVAANGREKYADNHYVYLAHEVDAERFGTQQGLKFCEKLIGKERTLKAFRERCRTLEKSDYPANLLMARVAFSKQFADKAFNGQFRLVTSDKYLDIYFKQARLNVRGNKLYDMLLTNLELRKCACDGVKVLPLGDSSVGNDKTASNDFELG